MNHKASTKCPKGHEVEFGSCQAEVKKLFGGTKICSSKGYEKLSSDEVKCVGCNTVYTYKTCPQCGSKIPLSQFEKKGLYPSLD